MKAIIQRVIKAQVKVNQKIISSINKSYLVFIGFCQDDDEKKQKKWLKKSSDASRKKSFSKNRPVWCLYGS